MIRFLGGYVLLTLIAGGLCVLGAQAVGRAFPGALLSYVVQGVESAYIYVRDVPRGLQVLLDETRTTYSPPSWSRDGRLVYVQFDEIIVWDGIGITNISQHIASDFEPAWLPDGRISYISNREGSADIYLWDGVSTVHLPTPDFAATDMAWSDDGRLAIAAYQPENHVSVMLWENDTFTPIVDGLGSAYSNLTWSDDGRLAFVCGCPDDNYEIYVWQDGMLTNVSQSPTGDFSPAWSEDGRLSFTALRSSPYEIYVTDETLTSMSGVVFGISSTWSAGGQLFYAAFDRGLTRIAVWDGAASRFINPMLTANEYSPEVWTP